MLKQVAFGSRLAIHASVSLLFLALLNLQGHHAQSTSVPPEVAAYTQTTTPTPTPMGSATPTPTSGTLTGIPDATTTHAGLITELATAQPSAVPTGTASVEPTDTPTLKAGTDEPFATTTPTPELSASWQLTSTPSGTDDGRGTTMKGGTLTGGLSGTTASVGDELVTVTPGSGVSEGLTPTSTGVEDTWITGTPGGMIIVTENSTPTPTGTGGTGAQATPTRSGGGALTVTATPTPSRTNRFGATSTPGGTGNAVVTGTLTEAAEMEEATGTPTATPTYTVKANATPDDAMAGGQTATPTPTGDSPVLDALTTPALFSTPTPTSDMGHATPTPDASANLTPNPKSGGLRVSAALRLSSLDIDEIITVAMKDGIQASIADLFNAGFILETGVNESIITQQDVNITEFKAGSVIVEFEVTLPPTPPARANGTQLTELELEVAAVDALGSGIASDNDAVEVFKRNGVDNVGEVSVARQPIIVQEAMATPAPRLPQPDEVERVPWWDPSQPLMMTIIATAGVIVIGLVVTLIVLLVQRRSAKIRPSRIDVGGTKDIEAGAGSRWLGSVDGENHDSQPPRSEFVPLPKEAPPPWDPPAANVKLRAAKTAGKFKASFSSPRGEGAEPYERLLLISSRFPDAMQVARAAKHSCAVGLYDWRNCTPHELLSHVDSMLGGHKVSSVAVLAPAGKGGAVGLMEAWQTTVEKLFRRADLVDFWKGLAGHVMASTDAEDHSGRIDLLSCRVTESSERGVELLRELQRITKLAVAASDDLHQNFPLVHVAEAHDGAQFMQPSGHTAIDLYFDASQLLNATNEPPPRTNIPAPSQHAGLLES